MPNHLEDLLLDSRFVGTVRHLRKLYLDPFTGKPWLLVINPEGRLIGVRSASQQPIQLRQALVEIGEEGHQTQVHSDVVFAFKLPMTPTTVPNSLPQQDAQTSHGSIFR